jgi:DNA-binding NtrC family response regulator
VPTLAWTGGRVPASLATAFAAERLQVVGEERAGGNVPLVVFTRSARLPVARREGVHWIWLCATDVGEPDRVKAVLRGAYDVIDSRSPEAVATVLARVRELLIVQDPPVDVPPHIVLNSEASRRMFAKAARVAQMSMSVLLVGETGTGKEILSRQIHAWSPRRGKAFVPINCAAIPDELMEAELFGYARGAFSGAVQKYDGQLMAAAGGTVFLDEIDETPIETQVKLLRVLEDRVVSRLGENQWHVVDFRLLAATNRDLRPLIEAGLFGADLFERLAIVTIRLAPLRERLDDLAGLTRQLMERFANDQHTPPIADVAADAMRALRAYPWPGNIRELRNVRVRIARLQKDRHDASALGSAAADPAPRRSGRESRGRRPHGHRPQDRPRRDEPARGSRGASNEWRSRKR